MEPVFAMRDIDGTKIGKLNHQSVLWFALSEKPQDNKLPQFNW